MDYWKYIFIITTCVGTVVHQDMGIVQFALDVLENELAVFILNCSVKRQM